MKLFTEVDKTPELERSRLAWTCEPQCPSYRSYQLTYLSFDRLLSV